MKPKPFNVATVLGSAWDLIRRKGWDQPGRNHEGYPGAPRSAETSYGGYCAHLALLEVAGATRIGGDAVKRLSLTVNPAGRGTSIELVAWNDARGRTLAEIETAFTTARTTP